MLTENDQADDAPIFNDAPEVLIRAYLESTDYELKHRVVRRQKDEEEEEEEGEEKEEEKSVLALKRGKATAEEK